MPTLHLDLFSPGDKFSLPKWGHIFYMFHVLKVTNLRCCSKKWTNSRVFPVFMSLFNDPLESFPKKKCWKHHPKKWTSKVVQIDHLLLFFKYVSNGCFFWHEILPSYVMWGNITIHFKDPYQTARIQWRKMSEGKKNKKKSTGIVNPRVKPVHLKLVTFQITKEKRHRLPRPTLS